MATIKKSGDYGVVEFNRVRAMKTGQIEAQLPLNATDFATTNLENGMLVTLDLAGGSLRLPLDARVNNVHLAGTAERIFNNTRKVRLADFEGIGAGSKEYARVYLLSVGDMYITNMVDPGSRTNFAGIAVGDYFVAANTGVPVYKASLAGSGAEGLVLQVVKKTTLPDGTTDAVQFEVVKNTGGIALTPTADVTLTLTTPAADDDNTITVGGASYTGEVSVENTTASVVLTGTKLSTQTVVVGGTDALSVTAAGTATAPTYTIDTDDIKTTGGTKEFTLTVSQTNKSDIVYAVTVTVAAA